MTREGESCSMDPKYMYGGADRLNGGGGLMAGTGHVLRGVGAHFPLLPSWE